MDSGVDCIQLVLVVERADAEPLSVCMHSRTLLLRLSGDVLGEAAGARLGMLRYDKLITT
jgi:hypothetical protein